MSRIKTKLRGIERAQGTRQLAAPQLMRFVGDGPAAQAVLAPWYGGPNAYLAHTRRGWAEKRITPTRKLLVEARYRDWLAERDADDARRAA